MSAPNTNQKVVKVYSERAAAHLNLVRGFPILHAGFERRTGKTAYFFARAAQADVDKWHRTVDHFRAEHERAQQAAAARRGSAA